MDIRPHELYTRAGPPSDSPPRSRRAVSIAAAILALLAIAALAVSNGGAGVASETTDGDLALAGVQAPGPDPGAKSVGGLLPSKKIVGALASKNAASTTSAPPGSTKADAQVTAARAVATTNATSGSSAVGAPSGQGSPSVVASPSTTAVAGLVPAPTTTTAPRTPPPSGGGSWTPTGPVYWLAADGNDAASGTETAPWRSFPNAISRLHSGDNLLVKAGTYGSTATGPTVNVEGVNGAPGAPITVAAAPGQQVNLLGGGWQVLRVASSSYIDIRGFDISGSAATERSTTDGIDVDRAHHVRLIANTVHDVGGGGINTIRANHVTVDANRVFNTAMWNPNQPSAISMFESANIGGADNSDGFSFYVRNNVAYNNKNLVGAITDGNCIIVDTNRQVGYSGATYIANNLCYANGGRGVHVVASDNVLAVNNTLVGNLTSLQMSDQGELSANQASSVSFRNNLVIPGRDGRGVREYAASAISYAYNLYVGSAPERRAGSDLVVTDARVGADYVPVAGSPAIDAGTTDGAPGTDRRGRARGGAPDIGCYEA